MQIQHCRVLAHGRLVQAVVKLTRLHLLVACDERLVGDFGQHMPYADLLAIARVQMQRTRLARCKTVLVRLGEGWKEGELDGVQEDKVPLERGRQQRNEERRVHGEQAQRQVEGAPQQVG